MVHMTHGTHEYQPLFFAMPLSEKHHMSGPDFANQANIALVDELYQQYCRDPQSVDADWRAFFAGFQLGLERYETDEATGLPITTTAPPSGAASAPTRAQNPDQIMGSAGASPFSSLQERVDSLIYAYKDLGHTACNLDPLGMADIEHREELSLAYHGLSEADLDTEVGASNVTIVQDRTSLRELIEALKQTYCGKVGCEYMHITDAQRRIWIRQLIEENRNQPNLSGDEKRRLLIKLSQAHLLETFIHTKFLGQKRFSLEGAESLIPGLDTLIETAAAEGAIEMVFGMAHRGRLNVLCNVLNKSYEAVFTEFEESYDLSMMDGNGDVKYHLGYSTDHVTTGGNNIRLTLTANPSHLEAVDPVVLGRTRAKQRQYGDTTKRTSVVPVLIHGDAAMSGQGVVMEVFQMGNLEGYRTGGTVHIVVNNQIGFTTLPPDSRSTRYCTDIAKMVEAPVFHVNGDDPEAVVHVMQLAMLYRQTYAQDVVVDLVCYRRWGHNESDEPNYTQPTMYSTIRNHPMVHQQYIDRLLQRGDLDQSEVDATQQIMKNQLQDALDSIKAKVNYQQRSRFEGHWAGFGNAYSHDPVETGVSKERLDQVMGALTTIPENFGIHPKIKRLLGQRTKAWEDGTKIDWAFAEVLSFGSLLLDNIPVRLSGQDSRRGTFSQRHSYWYDTNTRERYKPLNHITEDQANFCVYNSPLIEMGVLGFDYGYSLNEPNMLIIWEAQFGDFANGAQVIIDQFISSSEDKWGRYSGLVMMLPHGQEGAGPEHSSARLERFLQLCADDDMQVAYCSTAAQHFHILRRQVMRPFRKPLILMTPKSHLRSGEASSSVEDFVSGRFHEVLPDPRIDAKNAKRVILCTGKIGHELLAARDAAEQKDTTIIRIEQLYPWPEQQLLSAVNDLDDDVDLVFCQEEPHNCGAWLFLEHRLRKMFGRDVRYAGRKPSPSPAPGSHSLFRREQDELIKDALQIA